MATVREVLNKKPRIQEVGVISIAVIFSIIGVVLYQQSQILLSVGAFLIALGAFGWWMQVLYEEMQQ